MNCINCGYTKAKTVDTRALKNQAKKINCRKRDHKCQKCGEAFPTVQVPGTARVKDGKVVEIIIFADSPEQVTIVPRDKYVPRVPHGTTTGCG